MSERSGAPPAVVAETAWTRIRDLDLRIIRFLGRRSVPLLRVSLGVVFVWFGALKVAGVTPVADLVASVVYWVDPSWFVPVLGGFEILVGFGLISRRMMRLVLLLFALQMIGTFLVLILRPDIAFQDGNPLFLTVEGEFIIKNLVLLSAGLVVGAGVRALPHWDSRHSPEA
ncbi:MAG: DoxX family membrane protein [Acidimicrobiia bacterium]